MCILFALRPEILQPVGQEAVRVGQPGLLVGMPSTPGRPELAEVGYLRRYGLVLDSYWWSPFPRGYQGRPPAAAGTGSEGGGRVERGLGVLVGARFVRRED
jgi:hypothetical protein